MTDDMLVSAAEVARLAGVGRAAVSNWRRRYPDFPKPSQGTAQSPRFRLSEVERWLHDQGKSVRRSPRDMLAQALGRSDDEHTATARLAQAARYLADPTGGEAPGELRDVLSQLSDAPADELVEQLCEDFFSVQQRRHLTTPQELAELMAELAGPAATVFDPACGPGSLLRAAARHGATSVAGQEINATVAAVAQARLRLTTAADIRAGDALRADAFPGHRADAVLCHPPFAHREWGYEELSFDPRWEYGLPPKGESELAWVQHCLAHVRPGGRVVILLTAAVAARRTGRAVRQQLVRRGALRAVIALPGGALMTTGLPLHLWVLTDPEDGAGPVLLLDASGHQPTRRGQVDWERLRDEVLPPWRAFTETGSVDTVPAVRGMVEPIDLLDDDVDLTPARHLPAPEQKPDIGELTRTHDRLHTLLDELADVVPRVVPAERSEVTTTTLGDLAKAGALTLRQSAGRADLDTGAAGPLVLTGRDVAEEREPVLRLADEPSQPLLSLQPGDIVVPQLAAGGGRLRPCVVTESGLLLGPNLFLIRVDPDRLDVEFLAGQLAGAPGSRAGSTLSGVHRFDIRRIEVPVFDPAAQRVLGEQFRRLRLFRERLRTASALGQQLGDDLTDALAAGLLAPGESLEPEPESSPRGR